MKLFSLLSILLVSSLALADGNVSPNGATPVTVASSQAATTCVESNVAAGSAIAVSIPGVAGQYFYITSIEITLIAIAAPTATLTPVTSTNVPGSKSFRLAMQAAVGTASMFLTYATPLKTSVAGTATTFTGTVLANVSENMSVCGFYAP